MMLTVLGQQGDYYNKWRYDGEPVDSEEFKEAINGLKKYFDEASSQQTYLTWIMQVQQKNSQMEMHLFITWVPGKHHYCPRH